MSVDRPRPEEGVVLRSIDEVVEAAEKKKGVWPGLDEPRLSSPSPERPNFAERVSLWAMVGLLGVVTIYAIAKGNEDLLKIVLTIAAGTLYRLTRPLPEKYTSGETNDPSTKRQRKKRTPPE